MKIGIESKAYICGDSPLEGMLKMRRHGYECADAQFFCDQSMALLSCGEDDFLKKLIYFRECASEAEIEFSQAHAPWPYAPCDPSSDSEGESLEKLQKCIRGCKVLGCPRLVIHPIMPFEDPSVELEKYYRLNVEFFSKLAVTAAENDVIVCIENLPFKEWDISKPNVILGIVKEIASPYVKVCLDTVHAAVFGISPADAVRRIGKELLGALHIHDNNGMYDLHLPIFDGVIDWEDFRLALAEIGFDGTLSLETHAKLDGLNVEESEKKQIELAKKLMYLAGR